MEEIETRPGTAAGAHPRVGAAGGKPWIRTSTVGRSPKVKTQRVPNGDTCRDFRLTGDECMATRSISHRSYPRRAGFRLGTYVFKDAEIVDFAAPHGVFAVARRFDPGSRRLSDCRLDATCPGSGRVHCRSQLLFQRSAASGCVLIPGGFGTRQELHNARLHDFITRLADADTANERMHGSWILGKMGLLDGKAAPTRKEPDRLEASELARCRSTGWRRCACLPHQSRSSSRCWSVRHCGRDRVRHGDGFSSAAPGGV